MTSENSPTVENEALLTKIGAIEEEIVAVKSAIRQAGRVRLLLLIVAVAIIGGTIWAFYNLALHFRSKEYRNELTSAVQSRAKDSSDQALKEVKGLVEHCRPILTEAFKAQVEKDAPRYNALLEEQRKLLLANLEVRLKDRINERFEETGENYQAILRKEFPKTADPDLVNQLYANIAQIMEKLVDKYYSEQLETEVQELGKTWDNFDMADLPAEGEPSLYRQLMASLLQLAADKLDTQSNL